MVRNYKRKSSKGTFNSGDMQRAVQEVLKNGGKIRTVARDMKVDRMTLTRYVKKFRDGETDEQDVMAPKLNTRQVFTEAEEKSLEEYILFCSSMFHGFGCQQIQQVAFGFAKKQGISFPESWERNGMAGRDWMYGFLQRHPNISLQSPAVTSGPLSYLRGEVTVTLISHGPKES